MRPWAHVDLAAWVVQWRWSYNWLNNLRWVVEALDNALVACRWTFLFFFMVLAVASLLEMEQSLLHWTLHWNSTVYSNVQHTGFPMYITLKKSKKKHYWYQMWCAPVIHIMNFRMVSMWFTWGPSAFYIGLVVCITLDLCVRIFCSDPTKKVTYITQTKVDLIWPDMKLCTI